MIPAITEPLGRYWQQPPRERVLVDDTHAVVARADFEQLLEYSRSVPSGAYVGKMWRRREGSAWLLAWYGPAADATMLTIHCRELLVVA